MSRCTDAADFAESLKSDCLVKIYVGDDTGQEPFLVAKSMLEDTAPFFKKALQHAHSLGSGELDVLRFSEDDTDAWEVLLYWMAKHRLPERECLVADLGDDFVSDEEFCDRDHILLIRCWVLGEKYGIVDFQNEIMVRLVLCLDDDYISLRAAREAFDNTPTNSKLADLCMEELAIMYKREVFGREALNRFDGVIGFTRRLLTAMECDRAQREHPYRLTRCGLESKHEPGSACDAGLNDWKRFLVGDGSDVRRLEALIDDIWEIECRPRCEESDAD